MHQLANKESFGNIKMHGKNVGKKIEKKANEKRSVFMCLL